MQVKTFSLLALSEAVFFGVLTSAKPSVFSLIGMILWLVAFMLDRFFSKESAEQKASLRIAAIEKELHELKQLQTQMNLAQGIRSHR